MEGLVAITLVLEDIERCININKVPQIWHDNAYPSLKPLGSWFNDFLKRLAFLQKWIDEG